MAIFLYFLCKIVPLYTIRTVHRGGSRISRKGVHIYKDVGFALPILSHFS